MKKVQQPSLLTMRATTQEHPGLFPFPGCTGKIRASENVKIALTRCVSCSAVNVDFKTAGEVKRGVGLTRFSSAARLEPETRHLVDA